MEWLRVKLTDDEQKLVLHERDAHPSVCVRRRLLVIWSLHCGLTRAEAARIANVARSTVERDVSLYRHGGLEALRSSGRDFRPTTELAQHTEMIRQSFEQQPVRTMAEACHRIKELTGLERGQTQVRSFLKSIDLKWQRVRAIPVPPKKVSKNTTPSSCNSLKNS